MKKKVLIKMKLGIILTPDARSKAYLQKILKNQIVINEIIFMNDNRSEKTYSEEEENESTNSGFDISESVITTLQNTKTQYKMFNFVDINNHELIRYISSLKLDFIIYTGGGILKQPILNCGTKFVHIHPGIIPNYRGSTCFYYSIINENKCGVTGYIMDEGIDTGPIIYQREFEKPHQQFIDEIYDVDIRSETLIDILQNNLLTKPFKQSEQQGNTYYIIHPVLKHIAILSCLE